MPKKVAANKRRKEVGSSSNPGYDSFFFSSFEAFDLYNKKFKDRKLILGKNILFDVFVGFNLKALYDFMGWSGMCFLEGRVVPRMIRQFFANLEMSQNFNKYTMLSSYVDGKIVRIHEETLFEVLGIKNEGPRIFVSKSHPRLSSFDRATALHQITGNPNFPIDQTPKNSELIPNAKLLHSLNTYIFLPRSGHRDAINLMDVYLLDRLLNRRQTNLPHIILNHIFEAYKSPTNRLPYALLIQKVIEHQGVFVDEQNEDIESMGINDFLGERYLKGLGFRRRRDNTWGLVRNPRPRVEEEEEEGEEGEEGEDGENEEEEGEGEPSQNQGQGMPGQAQDSLELLRHDFNEFRGSVFEHFSQVNSNINRAFSLQEEFQRQQEEHHRQTQANHEEMMRMFQSMYPRPPPDY